MVAEVVLTGLCESDDVLNVVNIFSDKERIDRRASKRC